MKVERYHLGMSKKVDDKTTIFEHVIHASKKRVAAQAVKLAMAGFKPVGDVCKAVVEL